MKVFLSRRMINKISWSRESTFVVIAIFALCFACPVMAQSGLEGRISETIQSLVRIVNVLIAGFVVWAGFLIAKGDGTGFQRLIYGVIGLVVANGAYLIINYFR
ncbi:MAG: TrbC/VirB2 family protein [Bdellovibrionales bacterium]|nr:TrbC/VirB2 family protein [Bdellovibrionales bacterium]